MVIKKRDLKKIEQDLGKFWAKTRQYLKKAADESMVIAKKGEENLKAFSEKSKLTVEALILKTKQERLYHDLGRAVVKTGTLNNTKIESLRNAIKNLDKEIKAKERKAKSI